MKARLVPLYLSSEADADFTRQTRALAALLQQHADFLDPRPLGSTLPDADAVVFPQVLGEAYLRVGEIRSLTLPILVLTSEFGTMAMWDWELISYLRGEGIPVMAPYSLGQALTACRALVTKRELRDGTFVVYQDRPGGTGSVAPAIPRRFYWWQEECVQRIEAKFGLRVVKKSFEELGGRAKAVPDAEVDEEWARLRDKVPCDRCPLASGRYHAVEARPCVRGPGNRRSRTDRLRRLPGLGLPERCRDQSAQRSCAHGRAALAPLDPDHGL
jgi:hypothetical protein